MRFLPQYLLGVKPYLTTPTRHAVNPETLIGQGDWQQALCLKRVKLAPGRPLFQREHVRACTTCLAIIDARPFPEGEYE